MESQAHPLERFFHQVVRNSYEGKLGLRDPEVTGYIAHMLCEFMEAENLFSMRDQMGHPIDELAEMMRAADPVLGAAPSFDAERALRKHIGDYSLFVAGLYPEAAGSARRQRHHQPSLEELIRAGGRRAGCSPGGTSTSASSISSNTSRKRRCLLAFQTSSKIASSA